MQVHSYMCFMIYCKTRTISIFRMGYITKPNKRCRWHFWYHPIRSGIVSSSSFGVKSEAQSIKENGFLTLRNLVCMFIANNKYPTGEFCLLHLQLNLSYKKITWRSGGEKKRKIVDHCQLWEKKNTHISSLEVFIIYILLVFLDEYRVFKEVQKG